jgi:hypothetical protein
MRWTWMTAGLLVTLSCASVTKQDRIANSQAMAKAAPGTVVTERQLALADPDKTIICDNNTVVGTHIPTRRCRTQRQVDEEKKQFEARRAQGGCTSGGDMTPNGNVQRVPCVGN